MEMNSLMSLKHYVKRGHWLHFTWMGIPLSGSPANFEVYTAVLKPHDRIMGLDLPHGGHMSQGFMTPKRHVSGTSIYFESIPYRLDESTDIDYPRMRKITDEVGAFLMMDMAHISRLVAAGVLADPLEFCDIVTTTTHKSPRGPRGGMTFFKKDYVYGVDLESAINNAVFPGLQVYQNQVVSNCRALANQLIEHGYKLVSGGSDNHLGIDGARVEKILDMASITLNKNSVPGDKSALISNLRKKVEALTTRYPIPGV
ncbi:hypothetical protein K1719_021235 [Acacia pycnantha]|nr:hypothetical protein K1719_021235 [Acacia pycnantha]